MTFLIALFQTVFKMIVDAGKYSFNRSHAVAYAVIAYETAYYKYYYPKEFIAANLTNIYINGGDVKKRKEKLQEMFNDARELGIKFLPPDITKSSWKFSAKPKNNSLLSKWIAPYTKEESLITYIGEEIIASDNSGTLSPREIDNSSKIEDI